MVQAGESVVTSSKYFPISKLVPRPHLEVPVQEGVGSQAQQVEQPVSHGRRPHAQQDLGHHQRLGDHLQVKVKHVQ